MKLAVPVSLLALWCSAFGLSLPTLSAQTLNTTGVTDTFSRLYPSRTKTFVKSSSDPDDRLAAPERGNDDGFTGVNKVECYRERGINELAILTHVEGRAGFMGLFFKNYWTGLAGAPLVPLELNRGQIVVDGVVAYDLIVPDFHRNQSDPRGQVAPFSGPFTGNRAGGHVTHTPITWQNSFKVQVFENAFNNAARFHRVCGTLASPDDPITAPDLAAWETALAANGGWPHLTTRQATKTNLSILTGDAAAIELTGPATVLELTCKVAIADDIDQITARFTFDGMRRPSVEVPLRFLGGMMRKPYVFAFASLLFNNNGSDTITSYFPMHFRRKARLEFINQGSTTINLEVTHALALGPHPSPWGYFTAHYRRAITQTGVAFRGPRIDDARGMFRAIMLESSMNDTGNIPPLVDNKHLEGDLCIRINGNRGDDHNLDASETSIGKWGWYGSPSDVPFSSDGAFNSGDLLRTLPNSFAETNRIMGSTFVFDPIHFASGIDIVLEHGIQNTSNADYGLFTVFYVEPEAARVTILDLDVGNTAAEAHQAVSFTEKQRYVLTNGFFRDGFYGTPAVTDDVREIDGFYRFRVDVDADRGWRGFCLGVRVDRPKVVDGLPLQADVLVDGQNAGLWHSHTSNDSRYRWKEGGEFEVELPAAQTLGRLAFDVELRPRAGSAPLNLARAFVYGYLK